MRVALPLTWQQFLSGELLLTLLMLLVFKLCFLFGFFASFPDTVLHDRVLSEVNRLLPVGNRLEAQTVELGFPLQLQIDHARLIMKSAPLPGLTFETVALSPTLSTLIGQPGLNISAGSELGLLEGTVSGSGAVDLHLREGRFDFPAPEIPALRLAGAVTSLDLVGQLRVEKNEPLEFAAVVDELVLSGAKQLGLSQNVITLGSLSASLSGTGRTLQIKQLSLIGGVVTVTGKGRVVLQQPFSASRLDLKLNLKPEASADSGLRTLMELLGPKGKDGSHTLQLRGRLLAPQLK